MSYKLHPDTRLGAVKLRVSNLTRSLAFYQDIIGFSLLKQEGDTAELTADGKNALLVLQEVPNAVVIPPQSASGLYHYAILLPSRKALGVSLKRLVDAGLRVGQADHLVSEALYLSDPDLNGIEIYRDRPREEWKYNPQGYVNMATDPIDWEGLLKEGEGEPWTGLPEGTTIGHVHFHVGDMSKAKRFYSEALGFDIEADMMRMGALFLGAGRYHHHIGLNLWAGAGAPPVPPNGTGIDYFTIVAPNREELDKTAKSAEEYGFQVETDGVIKWLTDPYGIKIRLIAE